MLPGFNIIFTTDFHALAHLRFSLCYFREETLDLLHHSTLSLRAVKYDAHANYSAAAAELSHQLQRIRCVASCHSQVVHIPVC